jgi:thiamine pyrophosphokinase
LRAVIFANGVLDPDEETRRAIQAEDLLIAADGGAENCLALGFIPRIVIGDLDSLQEDTQSDLILHRAEFIPYPTDKDQTDLELALNFAIHEGVTEIVLIGLLGGRLDQTIANLLLLAREEWRSARLVVIAGRDTAYVLNGDTNLAIMGNLGDLVSLIPLTPDVKGVSTRGLKWPLISATLTFGSTLGISNELTDSEAEIQLRSGTLLLVHRKSGFSQV